MPFVNSDQISPRESMIHEWELDMFNKQSSHARELKKMEIELKKVELKLRQEEALKARKHSEAMKELEYAIRYQETRWRSLVKIPLMIIKLPVLIIIAIGGTIKLIRNQEIPTEIVDLFK